MAKKWTDEEMSVLRTYYPEWGAKKCKELLPDRALASIQKKAQKEGIACDLIKQRINLGLRTHERPYGFYVGSQGYWMYSPTGKAGDRVYYHRHVMEKHLGRELKSDEIVHHIDEDKTNNDITNLELTNRADHARHHCPSRKR